MESAEEKENSIANKNSVHSLKHKQEEEEKEEEGEEVVVEEKEEGDDVADLFGCISLHKKSSQSVHGGNIYLYLSLCVYMCM